MVRNTRFTLKFEAAPRPILAFGNDYPDDFEVTPHYHRRAQFLHGGSGVMTITPYHSGVDFEIAKRHNLDGEQIIDWRGKLLPIAGEFQGMNIKEAREKKHLLKIEQKQLEAQGIKTSEAKAKAERVAEALVTQAFELRQQVEEARAPTC